MRRALVVTGDSAVRDDLTAALESLQLEVRTLDTVESAFDHLSPSAVDVLFIDFCLRDGTGLELLEAARDAGVALNVLIGEEEALHSAEELLRKDVAEYLHLPVGADRLEAMFRRAGSAEGIREDERRLQEGRVRGEFAGLVGTSEAMQAIYDRLSRVGPSSATVLVTGESGTGKELVARAIHELSRRRHGPFVPVNCGAISPTLMESELFGHEKGSFTGASRRRKGLFEQADHGTLFLDEVTEMPLELQVKLLRVLETSRFNRIGGEESIRVDVRIVAATNRLPDEAIAEGKLREDLYYRLKVLHVGLPPLRERKEDIESLARHFLAEISEREGLTRRLPDDTLEALMTYGWPGNVRELRNALYTGFLLSEGDEVEASQLPGEVRGLDGEDAEESFDGSSVRIEVGSSVKEAERRLILTTLAGVDGHKTRAAKLLGVSLKTLYNRLHSYGYMPTEEGEEDEDEDTPES